MGLVQLLFLAVCLRQAASAPAPTWTNIAEIMGTSCECLISTLGTPTTSISATCSYYMVPSPIKDPDPLYKCQCVNVEVTCSESGAQTAQTTVTANYDLCGQQDMNKSTSWQTTAPTCYDLHGRTCGRLDGIKQDSKYTFVDTMISSSRYMICKLQSVRAFCTTPSCTDCTGSTDVWSEWSSCNATCGSSNSYRSRYMDTSVNGYGCLRETEYAACTNCAECQSYDWSQWSECNATCGSSNSYRSRYRDNAASSLNCSSIIEYQLCNCTNCTLSDWPSWSACNATCGHDSYRNRTQSIITEAIGRPACPSLANRTQYEQCNYTACVCAFSDWVNGPCSVSCGNGTLTRTRTSTGDPVDDNNEPCGPLSGEVACEAAVCTSGGSSSLSAGAIGGIVGGVVGGLVAVGVVYNVCQGTAVAAAAVTAKRHSHAKRKQQREISSERGSDDENDHILY